MLQQPAEAGASWVLSEGRQLSGRVPPGHGSPTGIIHPHSLPSVSLPGILIGWTPKEVGGTGIPLIVSIQTSLPGQKAGGGCGGEDLEGETKYLAASRLDYK